MKAISPSCYFISFYIIRIKFRSDIFFTHVCCKQIRMIKMSLLKRVVPFTAVLVCIFSFSACKRCYTCTKKCGTCTKTGTTVAGCDGDAIVQPYTVDTWKVYLESQGYTCAYNNVVESNVCSEASKKSYEDIYYSCISN